MQITLLGHASLYIETVDVRLLVDPVLVDPHQEGMFEVFPKRAVHWEHLPPFDLLFVSHQHLDHFDISTLARLPRDVQVIIPEDPILRLAFKRLGYNYVECVKAYSSFQIDNSRFLITPSEATHPEYGLVISDQTGTVWNQVDTIIDANHIDMVCTQAPTIDMLIATWQPMLELAWQYNQPVSFPYMAYAGFLDNIRRIQPKALVPGSNGYCYTNTASWLNHVVFPQSRERFLSDVVTMLPTLTGFAFPFDPGDILELRQSHITHRQRASAFITSDERNPLELEFIPATAQRPLQDSSGTDADSLQESVQRFIEQIFPAFVYDHPSLFRSHWDWGVIYQIQVAYAERSEYWWCDFRQPRVKFQPGQNPLTNLFCGITASGLVGLMNGNCGWDRVALSGDFFQHHRIYGVWENGLIVPSSLHASNPLYLIFNDRDAFASIISNQLDLAQMHSDLAQR